MFIKLSKILKKTYNNIITVQKLTYLTSKNETKLHADQRVSQICEKMLRVTS